MILVSLRAFPSLHPLVVHFPVVLIPMAVGLLAAAFLARSKALEWAAALCMLAGWASSLAAGQVFHPHTEGMTLIAQGVLDVHETWAKWTVGLSAPAALVIAWHSLIAGRRQRIVLGILAMTLSLAAAGSVLIAGHQGATLTHIHHVGEE